MISLPPSTISGRRSHADAAPQQYRDKADGSAESEVSVIVREVNHFKIPLAR
jgi:hypothetical protein